MKKSNKIQIFRIIVLLGFLVGVSILAFMHQIKGGGPDGTPSVHALCPFGFMETIYQLIATGEFIDKINISNIILMAGTIVLVFFVGRCFCGFICAFGALQELFEKLGLKIFKKRFVIPKKIDKILRFSKYVVLILVLIFTWKAGKLVIDHYDPWSAYAHIPAGIDELVGEFLIGFIILIVSIIASILVSRFFCKYICPLGAVLGILNKFNFYKITRDENTCIHCKLCNKKCPVNIDVESKKTIKDAECINCLQCLTVCPTKKETMKARMFGKKINPGIIAVIGVVIYLGIIGLTIATGIWQSLPDTALVDNPDNIKGWHTIEIISDSFNIEAKTIYDELKLSPDKLPKDMTFKNAKGKLKEINFETDNVREAVRSILEKEGKLLPKDNSETNSDTTQPSVSNIKGTMTIKDVSEMFKVDTQKIYDELDLTPEELPHNMSFKNAKEKLKDKNFDAEAVRKAISKILDK